MAKARKISEMKQLDIVRKNTDRLIRGSHTKDQISDFLEKDVPNLDQRVKLKHEIYLAHDEHLDHILYKMQTINEGKEKMSFSPSSNDLITVYPHSKLVSKHPLKLETVYKPHKSYFIADPELYERYLSLQELEDMRELFRSKDINRKVMQEQKAEVNEYWSSMSEQGYTLEEIGDLFYTSKTTIINGIKQAQDQGITWKYFN